MQNADYAWFVVDTWGHNEPIGCWTEAAARALPARIESPIERGRYKVKAAQNGASSGLGDPE